MKLLVTRPLSASTELAATLMERGHSVICSPLLTVKFNENVALTFDGVQGLVVTSMNGVQGLARNTTERELPLYCVGDKTAQVSSELGFKNVHSANGDVNSLFDLVVREVDPSRGTLLHLGGARLAGDLKGLLEKAGYKYQREILYEAIDASKLNSNAVEAILDGSLNGVLLFSPHTAKVFCKLIDEPDLKAQIRHLTAWCLSQNVANELVGCQFRNIYIADHPSEKSLLDLIQEKENTASSEQSGPDNIAGEQTVSDKPGQGTSKPSDTNSKTVADNGGSKSGSTASTTPGSAKIGAGQNKPKPDSTLKTEQASAKPSQEGTSSNLTRYALLALIAFLLGVAAWPVILPSVVSYLPEKSLPLLTGVQNNSGEVQELKTRIAEVEAKLGEAQSPDLKPLEKQLQDLNVSLDSQVGIVERNKAALEQLLPRLTVLESRLAQLSQEMEAGQASAVADLNSDSAQIETLPQQTDLTATLDDLQLVVQGLKTEIDSLQKSKQSSEAELTAQKELVAALEKSLEAGLRSAVEVNANGDQALALLALGQLHRESRTDKPFVGAWQQAMAALPDTYQDTIAQLSPVAKSGAPTLLQLQESFSSLAIDITQAARLPSSDTWYGKTLHNIASLVKFRKVSDTQDDSVDAKVARAEKHLAIGNLDDAVAVLEQLDGASAEVAKNWIEKANARHLIDQTLSQLMSDVGGQVLDSSADGKQDK